MQMKENEVDTRKKKVLRDFTARIRNLFENEILERAPGGGDDA